MATDWQMSRPADGCGACNQPFPPGSLIRAWLVEEGDGFARVDQCLDCPAPERHAIASWRTQRASETPARRPAFDAPGMLDLFQSLADSPAEDAGRLRFVLALLLWRKKVLRLTATKDTPDGEVWTFEESGGRAHAIARPDLDETQVEQLSIRLEQLTTGAAANVPAA